MGMNARMFFFALTKQMFNWFRKAYENYRDYIRVDLAMYALLILMVLIYAIWKAVE